MAKMFFKNHVPEGESTQGMTLVRNRTSTAKTVTVDGHVLGGREIAWVTSSDPVLIFNLEKDILRAVQVQEVKNDKVDVVTTPVVQNFEPTNQFAQKPPAQKVKTGPQKRKPKR